MPLMCPGLAGCGRPPRRRARDHRGLSLDRGEARRGPAASFYSASFCDASIPSASFHVAISARSDGPTTGFAVESGAAASGRRCQMARWPSSSTCPPALRVNRCPSRRRKRWIPRPLSPRRNLLLRPAAAAEEMPNPLCGAEQAPVRPAPLVASAASVPSTPPVPSAAPPAPSVAPPAPSAAPPAPLTPSPAPSAAPAPFPPSIPPLASPPPSAPRRTVRPPRRPKKPASRLPAGRRRIKIAASPSTRSR